MYQDFEGFSILTIGSDYSDYSSRENEAQFARVFGNLGTPASASPSAPPTSIPTTGYPSYPAQSSPRPSSDPHVTASSDATAGPNGQQTAASQTHEDNTGPVNNVCCTNSGIVLVDIAHLKNQISSLQESMTLLLSHNPCPPPQNAAANPQHTSSFTQTQPDPPTSARVGEDQFSDTSPSPDATAPSVPQPGSSHSPPPSRPNGPQVEASSDTLPDPLSPTPVHQSSSSPPNESDNVEIAEDVNEQQNTGQSIPTSSWSSHAGQSEAPNSPPLPSQTRSRSFQRRFWPRRSLLPTPGQSPWLPGCAPHAVTVSTPVQSPWLPSCTPHTVTQIPQHQQNQHQGAQGSGYPPGLPRRRRTGRFRNKQSHQSAPPNQSQSTRENLLIDLNF